MKYFNKLLLFITVTFFSISCTVNDPIGEVVTPGEFVPTIFWDVPAITVAAGGSVEFSAQYYSTLKKSEISRVEVWYALDQTITKTARCPLFEQQGLFLEFADTELTEDARPSLLVKTFAHDESSWDAKKAAYQLSGTFPVSYNLSSIKWGKDREFDEEGYQKYFEDGYLERFRDTLYSKMNAYNFKKLLTADFELLSEEEFAEYTYNVYDPVEKDSILMIKQDAQPEMKRLMYTIPTDSLLYDNENAMFLISFEKSFIINANLKAIDKENRVGVSEIKAISIN